MNLEILSLIKTLLRNSVLNRHQHADILQLILSTLEWKPSEDLLIKSVICFKVVTNVKILDLIKNTTDIETRQFYLG